MTIITFAWTITVNIGKCVTSYNALTKIVSLTIADDPSAYRPRDAIKRNYKP